MTEVYTANGRIYVETSGGFVEVDPRSGESQLTGHLPHSASLLVEEDVAQEESYNDGYDAGYSDGESQGYTYDDLDDARQEGYDDGYEDGRNSVAEEKDPNE